MKQYKVKYYVPEYVWIVARDAETALEDIDLIPHDAKDLRVVCSEPCAPDDMDEAKRIMEEG